MSGKGFVHFVFRRAFEALGGREARRHLRELRSTLRASRAHVYGVRARSPLAPPPAPCGAPTGLRVGSLGALRRLACVSARHGRQRHTR